MSQNEFIIGLDIGATYSKVSYVAPSNQELKMCIFEQSTNAFSLEQVAPTVLYYNNQSTPIGWGYDTAPGAQRLRLFKYSMLHEDDWHPDTKNRSVLVNSMQTRNHLHLKAVDVLAHYIDQLWTKCGPQLGFTPGTTYEGCSLRAVITYPVGWPHHQFQEAFNKSILAKLTTNYTVMLLNEAEAAMEAIIRAVQDDDISDGRLCDVDLQAGDQTMLADCGGLTLDIVCGAITSEKAILGFKPITVPTSTLCGASLMTDAFIKLLEDKAKMLLTDTVALDSLFWEQAVQRWETEIMPSMIPNGSQTWTFRLPVASLQATKTSASQIYSRWLEKGELPIFSQEISSILDFAVDSIVRLIRSQVEELHSRTQKDPKYLFVTGGFACNPYLRAGIRDRTKGLPVTFSPASLSRSAVAQGAAIYGLKISKSLHIHDSAVAKHNYGIETDGNQVRLVSKGEYMTNGMLKRVALPWEVIESAGTGGDGTIRLRICRIADVVQVVHIVKWRPKYPVSSNDTVALEMRWIDDGELVEWAFWQNGMRQSGAPCVSEEYADLS